MSRWRVSDERFVQPGSMSGPTGQGLGPGRVGWGWRRPCDGAPAFGAVGARAIPFSKATELNDQVIALDVDVTAWVESKIGPLGPLPDLDAVKLAAAKFSSPTDRDFWIAWLTFKIDWDSFYTHRRDNPPPWYAPIPSYAMTEAFGDLPKYDALLARFQAMLAQAKKLGVATAAATPDQGSAAEQVIEDATKGLGEGLGKAADTLGELGTYVLVAGAVIGGLYVAAPFLLARMRR